jgi:hypothetical protein
VTVYSVYEPADAADLEARSAKVAFVKDGIAWLALAVPILWLIYHRMWLELVAFLVIFMSLPLIFGSGPAGREIAGWASIGLTVVFAFEANDLRCWALRRRGFKFAGTAWGRDRIEAETHFFSRWLPEQEKPSAPVPVVVPPPQSSAGILPTRLSGGDEVIGSFPRS